MYKYNKNFGLTFSENPFVSWGSDGKGLSRVYDCFWDFTVQGETLKGCSFKKIPKEHRTNVQSYVYKILTHQKNKDVANHIPISRIIYWRDSLNYLVRTWGKSDFSLLSNDAEWREAKSKLNGVYSIKSLSSLSSTINSLNNAGLVNRHVEGNEMKPLASLRQQMQYIALPSGIHKQILEKTCRIIEKYYEYRYEISNVMQQALELRESIFSNKFNYPSGSRFEHTTQANTLKFRFESILKNYPIQHNIPDFKMQPVTGAWVKDIIVDCLFVVGFFSGARKNEILSMQMNSYRVIGGIPTLQGQTTKSNKGVPIATTWVTHPIVKKALCLAYDITQYARNIKLQEMRSALSNKLISKDRYQRALAELNSVFISVDMRFVGEEKWFDGSQVLGLKSLGSSLHNYIAVTHQDVDEFNLLNPAWEGALEVGGKLPAFSLHSLRRSFAVFMVRNKLGNTQTIKYQFKHQNISMSDWYANHAELMRMESILLDKDLLEMVMDANVDVAVDAFDEIYNKSETLSGGGGERIYNKKKAALQRGEQVAMSREEISRLVRNKSLSIVLLPTGGYCTNSDCERLCSIESFIAESKPCEHEIITSKGAKVMAKQRERLIKAFRDMNAIGDYAYSRILVGYKEKILVLEQTLEKHNINFELFTDKIKVLS